MALPTMLNKIPYLRVWIALGLALGFGLTGATIVAAQAPQGPGELDPAFNEIGFPTPERGNEARTLCLPEDSRTQSVRAGFQRGHFALEPGKSVGGLEDCIFQPSSL